MLRITATGRYRSTIDFHASVSVKGKRDSLSICKPFLSFESESGRSQARGPRNRIKTGEMIAARWLPRYE